MKTLIYLFQVSACTGIFYVFYFVLLRKLTFFSLNRWYLLVTLLLSFIIPSLTWKADIIYQTAVMHPVTYVQEMRYTLVQQSEILDNPAHIKKFDWIELIIASYGLVAFLFFVRMMFVLFSFKAKLLNKPLMSLGGAKIYKGNQHTGNSSFLNLIFINDSSLSSNEFKQVVAHELIHVKLYHSVDRILVWLAQIVLWFNPFVYGYMRSIEENHEFEVDRLAGKGDSSTYAALLLKLSTPGQGHLLQGFSRTPLKKRVLMLFNQPTPHMKKIVYVLVLPVVVFSCLAFSDIKINAANVVVQPKSNLKSYLTLKVDTSEKYRQKVKRTSADLKSQEDWMAYSNTDEYKANKEALNAIFNKEQEFTVKAYIDTVEKKYRYKGFIVTTNSQEFILDTRFGEDKQLDKLLHVGDKFSMKLHGGGFGIHTPISITAAYVKKDDVKIFEIAESKPLPKYPFLYEANKVRFADGQITKIQTYANGKWKSADVEVVNGYKFHLKFKPNAPVISGIEESDHVRFRFVHEVKTGAKEYAVSDWVSLTTDIKDYGVKNPDFFYKFYERI